MQAVGQGRGRIEWSDLHLMVLQRAMAGPEQTAFASQIARCVRRIL